MTSDLLSAVILLESWSPASDADATLLALAVQEWENLQVVLVCNETQLEGAGLVCANQPWTQSTRVEIIALPATLKDNNANRLNTALDACSGQYVTVLQSNDIAYGFAFAKLIKLLQRSPEAVAIGGTRNASTDESGYVLSKNNHSRAGKKTFDIWFDEDCARNFVVDRNKVKGNFAAEPALDAFAPYFLLLTLSLHNEFNFSLAGESMFERRIKPEQTNANSDVEGLRLRARSKIIDWKSNYLSALNTR